MDFTLNLSENISIFKGVFKNNCMIVYRSMENAENKNIKAEMVFADGLSGAVLLNDSIVKPFCKTKIPDTSDMLDYIHKSVLRSNEVTRTSKMDDCVTALFSGDAILILDGYSDVLIVNVRKPASRSISEPENERSLKGPRDGFSELILDNTALLMRRIKNKNFKLEKFIIGSDTKSTVILAYIEGICDSDMLVKVRKRISDLKLRELTDTNGIAELIKGKTYTPFKTGGSTERPDVTANKLLSGRMAIMIDGSPQVITLPFVFSEYFQSNDDYTINFYFASISRLIRYICFYLSIYLPGVYVAAIKFHKTIIPFPLLLSIAQARKEAPFSVTAELFVFLIFFEIIREAGTRTPSDIGQTLSIVSGIVLSETAISANLISAPSIIVIAVAGLAGVTLPQLLGAGTILRIAFLLLGSLMGIYGIALGSAVLFVHLCSITVLNVPYINSTLPLNRDSVGDTVIRLPFTLLSKKCKNADISQEG